MKLDLLAIAAHPDDVELTCGGTLIKMARRGYAVGILDLTGGEMGTRGSVEIRRKEAAAAARILGVAHRENLGLPDAHLEMRMDYKLAIANRIRALRPRTVILPYWEGRHPDHYTASRLGYEGCFLAGLKRLDLEGEAYRPFKVLYSTTYDRSAAALVCRWIYRASFRGGRRQSSPTDRSSGRKGANGAPRCIYRSIGWCTRCISWPGFTGRWSGWSTPSLFW